MKPILLFTLAGLRTTISVWGSLWFLALIPLVGWLAAWILQLSAGLALLAGVLTTLGFFASDWLHQWGHARAARQTGYPMTGMHFFFLFAASQYPLDEPELPARTHLQRALGGWWVNTLIGALLAPLAFYLWPGGGVVAWVVASLAIWNFFILGLGAFFPMYQPFETDGGTILKYWGKKP